MKQHCSEAFVGAGGGTLVRSERRSSRPVRAAVIIKETVARALEPRRWGESRTTIISAQPNQRLKLTAPVFCGRIAFVTMKAWRRSLGASR